MNRKILVINTVGLQFNGITTVIYNYLSAMDRTGMEIDFLAFDSICDEIREKFEKIGRIIIVPERKKDLKGYAKALGRVLKSGYDVVHIHGNSSTMAIDSLIARLNRVGNVIVHSHSTSCDHPFFNVALKPLMRLFADTFIACSEKSGNWLYKSGYIVLNNAIDTEKFAFNENSRQSCRRELGVEDEYLIGHIGHFTVDKNQSFLVDVFSCLHKLVPRSKLLLIGQGGKLQEVRDKVRELGLDEYVVFAGVRNDIDRLYQAMDIFVLPSLWEGLPLVMLEAQAAVLPVIVSTNVTGEARCTELVRYKPLDDGAESWAEQVIAALKNAGDRNMDTGEAIRKHGFDICQEAKKLRDIYCR